MDRYCDNHFSLFSLFCGLSNGYIRVYDRTSGQDMTLKVKSSVDLWLIAFCFGFHSFFQEHKSEVHCVQLIDSVLISGDWDGRLILWKPNPIEQTFTIGASLDVR